MKNNPNSLGHSDYFYYFCNLNVTKDNLKTNYNRSKLWIY